MARVHLYYGEGEGKTLASLGQALRSIGQGKDVIIIQFMKGRKDIGEYKIADKLEHYRIYQFGTRRFVDLKHPSEKDKERARKGMEFARRAIKEEKPFVLILDEVTLACYYKIIDENDVIDAIKNAPKNMLIILTGRKATKKLLGIADLITYMKEVKHPFQEGIKAKRGIEF